MVKLSKYLLLALVLFCGCKEEKKFCIEGNISGADSSMLYLEHLTLGEGNVVIDSIRLTADGAFRFEEEGVASPDRLEKGAYLSVNKLPDTVHLRLEMTHEVLVNGLFCNADQLAFPVNDFHPSFSLIFHP